MATVPDDVERKGVLEDRVSDAERKRVTEDRISGSADEKPGSTKIEDVGGAAAPVRHGHQAPAWIAALTVEERAELERKLKRKIDFRLLPAVIVMYILNYIDRYVFLAVVKGGREGTDIW